MTRWRAGLVASAVLVAAGCSRSLSAPVTPGPTATTIPSPSPAPVSESASDDLFVFTVTVPRTNFQTDEVIDIRASLEYLGPDTAIEVRPSDLGLVWFSFEQLDGPLAMGPFSHFICAQETVMLTRGKPLIIQPQKAASWTSEDPAASFYEAWAADPFLRLPAGQWSIATGAEMCDGKTGDIGHRLRPAPLTLTISP